MRDNNLRKIWIKLIRDNFLYRIVSEEYLPTIKKEGLIPGKDPFKNKEKEINEFFDIVLNLKSKGFIMIRWWGKPVDQEEVIRVTRKDMALGHIDFTPNFNDTIDYYLALKGGALANTVRIFAEEILMKNPSLSVNEMKLVNKMSKWSIKKCSYNNKVLWFKASSDYFENAIFKCLQHKKNIESPLGNFENFKKAIDKNGLDIYLPYLNGEYLYYIRCKNKIPPEEITKITTRAP